MATPTRLLDEAFENALSTAATLDEKGLIPEDTQDLFPDRSPTNVELVQAGLDFYNENQAVMDRAIQGALNLLSSPDGVARIKALEGSFETLANDSLSVQLASEMRSSGEFGVTHATEAQGLEGFGIGISAGASAIVGVLAGADIVFNHDQVIPRKWVGGSLKGGLSVSGGLELSFWVNKPLTGAIKGWLIDLFVPQYGVFIRFMYINARPTGKTSFTFSGVSLQFPLGIGFPIRLFIGKKPGVTAGFAAQQDAAPRPTRATFDVVNKATGVSTIAVQETTTLTATLKNTSGSNFALSAGATMTIGMPGYFTDADVSNMNIALQGWNLTKDGDNLILTLAAATTWQSNAELSFDITNAHSSKTPQTGQPSIPGVVTLNMNDTSFDAPIVNTASFALVWENSEASLVWSAKINPGFTLEGPASGEIPQAYAQPGNVVVQLTTAKEISTGIVWVLGYIFNYNTASSNVEPQVTAVWWNQKPPQVKGNLITATPVSASGETSTCYNSTGSTISVTPTFDTSG